MGVPALSYKILKAEVQPFVEDRTGFESFLDEFNIQILFFNFFFSITQRYI